MLRNFKSENVIKNFNYNLNLEIRRVNNNKKFVEESIQKNKEKSLSDYREQCEISFAYLI